jgi:hypothetical protein
MDRTAEAYPNLNKLPITVREEVNGAGTSAAVTDL